MIAVSILVQVLKVLTLKLLPSAVVIMAGIKTLVLLLVTNHATAEPCTTVAPAPKAPAPCTTVGPTQPPANPCTPHAPGPAPKPLPPTTCATYNCPKAPWVKIAHPAASACSANPAGGICSNQYCCRCMTTTPKPVVYKPTCATYTCPTWWTADATKATVKCPAGWVASRGSAFFNYCLSLLVLSVFECLVAAFGISSVLEC